jgi:ribonuclease-3
VVEGNATVNDSQSLADLQRSIGIDIDPDLFLTALTHRSFSVENNDVPTYERLEFLGDAALGCVIAEFMYGEHPDAAESQLTPLRAAIINAGALADAARALGLGPHVRLGKGEMMSGGQEKSSILADVMESVMGAVFVTHGFHIAREFILRVMDEQIAQAAALGAGLDWKTSLQELAASLKQPPPVYEIEVEGPDHARLFTARAVVAGVVLGAGSGTSKRQAERIAAQQAYTALHERADARTSGS